MRDTHTAPRTFELAVVLAQAGNGRALWRGFGLIDDDTYALVEHGLEADPASEAGARGAAWNTQG
jgi:hypothetical protein